MPFALARFNHFDDYKLIQHKHNTYKTKFKLNDYKLSFLRLFRSISSSMWMATYSSKDNSSKNVSISLSLEEGMIKFKVQDEGTGFDFHKLPDPTLPENISRPGGRGIFLMKHLSDEVDFKENGKVVELSFYVNQ